jgi:hypothetical protein
MCAHGVLFGAACAIRSTLGPIHDCDGFEKKWGSRMCCFVRIVSGEIVLNKIGSQSLWCRSEINGMQEMQ